MDRLDYRAVEEECGHLAIRLQQALGSALDSARFLPIPRGGLVVLGLLSYYLRLSPSQLQSRPGPGDGPLVIVDDCSLSGHRFREVLSAVPDPWVVFAPLVSPAPLRDAILKAEARVRLCISARDLRVGERPEWQRQRRLQWLQHRGLRPYWIGSVLPVAFPWSEPDTVRWDPETGAPESNWRRVSPIHCLKNRSLLQVDGVPARAVEYDLPEGIRWRILSDRVGLWHRSTGYRCDLPGVAGWMWRALMALQQPEAAVAWLVRRYDVAPTTARRDLDELVRSLLERGLLVRMGGDTDG